MNHNTNGGATILKVIAWFFLIGGLVAGFIVTAALGQLIFMLWSLSGILPFAIFFGFGEHLQLLQDLNDTQAAILNRMPYTPNQNAPYPQPQQSQYRP